jgi:glycosyltransferase involved in cell wall biosynthesis
MVSVVLPTYKRAHLLHHAIRSVLDQSYPNIELIVVDDNSPDDTPAVVAAFDDPRIRYVRNEPNLKLPRALNRGFSLSRGAFLTWTSDDNFFAKDAIARMVEFLQQSGCDFVYADYYLFSDTDEHGRPQVIRRDSLPDALELEKGNRVGACFMYTRAVYETIGEYDPELFLVEDYDYFIRIAQRFRLGHLPEALYFFRRDDETLYCSRFREVKASDVLVRFKNGLLGPADAIEAVVELILRTAGGLRNPYWRWSLRVVPKLSYRLGRVHRKLLAAHLRRRLGIRMLPLLRDYEAGNRPFSETRDALSALMTDFGDITYSPPPPK